MENISFMRVDEVAQELGMAEAESVTETLKAANQMEWVSRINNIRNRAMETVNSELIYRA